MKYGQIQPRRARIALIGMATAALATAAAHGTVAAQYPPDETLRADAVTTVCLDEVPYIQYSTETLGFDSAGLTATITILDSNGAVVAGPTSGMELSGHILYPGAKVDGAGNGIDWPGWTQSNGTWVKDPSDEHLRSGLQVRILVNPEVTVPVTYPPETQACMSPSSGVSPAAGATGGGTLPTTGTSDTARTLWIATGALLAGVVITAASFRRRGAAVSSS